MGERKMERDRDDDGGEKQERGEIKEEMEVV